MSILILAPLDDPHAQYVSNILDKAGAKYRYFHFSSYPDAESINFELFHAASQTGKDGIYLKTPQDDPLDLMSIRAVWNRRSGQPQSSHPDPYTKKYIDNECAIFKDCFVNLLSEAFWLSRHDAVKTADRKPYQLWLAKQLGFSVPDTFIGNDADSAKAFVSQFEELAVKPLYYGAIKQKRPLLEQAQVIMNNAISYVSQQLAGTSAHSRKEAVAFSEKFVYTQRLSRAELLNNLDQLTSCPIIIQHYIPKKLELRITVVGNKVFPCAIYSQQSELTKTDWRRYDLPNTPHEPYDLPPRLEQIILDYVNALNLQFGCIDMIVTPDNDYVFLEINPNGQWRWIQDLTGLPIGEEIATLLIHQHN